jgi:hypothetical protein
MNPTLSRFTIFAFVFTSVLAEFPQNARADGFQYTAYVRPKDRRWNRAWTPGLLSAIAAQKARFEEARDIENFCPGYAGASPEQKNNCFVRLFTGISAWESSNNPNDVGDRGQSIGLLQVGTFNCKREGFNAAALKNPNNNTRCGARLAGDLIHRDRVISSEWSQAGRWGTTRVKRLGLGRGGWSTMMLNVMWHGIQVGRLKHVAGGMATYKDPRAGSVAVLEKKRKILV